MSSTTGFQNLLVNVFRPVYRYETPAGASNSIFVPKLEMSNIDTYSGNSVSVFTAAVGDSNSNVYVGSNAGNLYSVLNGCRYVSAFGYSAAAGISNVANSVFFGYNAGAGATDVSSTVVIGANAEGGGVSNVRIGFSNTGTGDSNVSIGASTGTSGYSNCIVLGRGITATQDNQFRVGASYIWGDQSNKWLGIGTPSSIDVSYNALDVSGNVYVDGAMGINMIPTRTFDVNGDFRSSDANGTLDFNSGDLSITGGFNRTLSSTAVAQPIIQYGSNSSGSGNSGSVSVTIPTAYASSTSYVTQITLNSSSAGANISVNNSTSNSFTIYWTNAGSGSHTFFWTTFGL